MLLEMFSDMGIEQLQPIRGEPALFPQNLPSGFDFSRIQALIAATKASRLMKSI